MASIKVVHVITGLETGGAEMMLYKILAEMDRDEFKQSVISLTNIGPVGKRIQAIGVPVRTLGMRRGLPNPLAVVNLARWLRKTSPDLIQSWMYHADLLAGIASKMAGGIPLIWGIRHSNLDLDGSKRGTIWTAKICAALSRWLPAHILCCSEASLRVHAALGYSLNKMSVIPNGFELDAFKPDALMRQIVRQELNIPESVILVGLVARFDPQKDHQNFINAAGIIHTKRQNVHFLLCGAEVNHENAELMGWIKGAELGECCHLLGRRQDVPRIVTALDIATSSSSFGEGFPNVVGEAMACGVPCVVTDVGDSALIVGNTGKVVQPRDPRMLARAWQELIDIGGEAREQLGKAARCRIEENYSIHAVARRYEQLYRKVAI